MLNRRSFLLGATALAGLAAPAMVSPAMAQSAPPSSCNILVEIDAEWNAGMISTLAGPVRRLNG